MQSQFIVYRYTDLYDGVIKYVGITSRPLSQRVREHKMNEPWEKTSKWLIEYFRVATKSEMEAWESHLIAEYHTDQYYNTAKSGWGQIQKFQSQTPKWRAYSYSDKVIDFPVEKLPRLDNTDDLISESQILYECNWNHLDLLLALAQHDLPTPVARDANDDFLFLM